MARREYKGAATPTTLSASITNSATSLTITDATNWPTGSFSLVIDPGLAGEEKILAASRSGTTVTLTTRGYDNTSASSHTSGAVIYPVPTAIDFDEANSHVNSSSGVHGLTGSVVGTTDTQTLTNKALSDSTTTIVDVTDATKAIKFDIAGTTAITGTIATAFTTAKTVTIPDATDTLVGKATTDTLTNKTLTAPIMSDAIVRGFEEDVNVVASAATGTINFDISTASVWYYTSNATANHTLNFRYSSGTTLNSSLLVGDAITLVWLNTNGATPYYPNVIQIDGTTVTPKVPAAISAGNASAIDAYTFTIIKTAATPTYTVLETQTKFA